MPSKQAKKIALILLTPLVSLSAHAAQKTYNQYQYSGDTLPKNLITLNSPKGIKLFKNKKTSTDLGLLSYFVTEKGLTFCGMASSVMVLNDLNIPTPSAPQHAPYTIFNQNNFFNKPGMLQILRPARINFEGASLGQLTAALKLYAPNTHKFYAGQSNVKTFRRAAIDAVKSKNKDIIINFCRKNIGETNCGHFSPLAAYNAKADRFLLLDVARYKYPPVWVKTATLFNAMNTIGHNKEDPTSKKTRGYIIIENNACGARLL